MPSFGDRKRVEVRSKTDAMRSPPSQIFQIISSLCALLATSNHYVQIMASINLPTRRLASSLIRAAYRPSKQQLKLQGCDGVEGQRLLRQQESLSLLSSSQCFRKASTYSSSREMAELSEDVDPTSSLTTPGPTASMVQSFDPVKRSKARKVPLPRSR